MLEICNPDDVRDGNTPPSTYIGISELKYGESQLNVGEVLRAKQSLL